jgi:nucleotide-binding universal stress UspA family protein
MRIKTILCPVDRSDISDRAVAYATALARQYVARLSVLEVIDWRLPPVAGSPVELPEMPPEVQADALGHLNVVTTPAREAGVPTEVGIDVGPVVKRILERASHIHADLIVLGTHGRSGFDRLALGSVAEKILRKAHCPVLAVPPGSPLPASRSLFGTILCAVDFSSVSPEVFSVAADLARRYGCRLVVVNVAWPFDETTTAAAEALRRDFESRAREMLTRLVAAEAAPPTDVSAVVLTGTPKDAILACARERHADLIVLGVSGHGAIDRALFGSTAHGVVRHSACPVLALRGRGDGHER